MNPLISVIVPVYKVEKYLERCVNSIRRQSYENLEILLIDDGSPDGCGLLCDGFAEEDRRIKVIHKENGGLSSARNDGIDIAGGEYLIFVDSDDFLAGDFVKVLYEALCETGSDIAQCKWEYVTGDKILREEEPGENYVYTGHEMLKNLYIPDGAYFVVAWNKLYKRELFAAVRYPEGRIHEDEATTYKIFDGTDKAVFVDRFLYGYYKAEKSITRNSFYLKRLDWLTAMEERIEYFKGKKYDDLVVPTIKAYADGAIDLYYQCRENLQNSKDKQREIKSSIKKYVKEAGGYQKLPFRTAAGYYLFFLSGGFYGMLRKKFFIS